MTPIEEELRKEIRKFVISTSFCDVFISTGELSRKMNKFNFMFDRMTY